MAGGCVVGNGVMVRGELWVNWCGVRCRGRGKWKCGIRSVGGVFVVGEVEGV